VVSEAIGSGCVPLVSETCADSFICRHMVNGLVHPTGDVETLRKQITMLHKDRVLLKKLREGALRTAPDITWKAAGRILYQAYQEVISKFRERLDRSVI